MMKRSAQTVFQLMRTPVTKKATIARSVRGSRGERREEGKEVEEGDGDLTFSHLAYIDFEGVVWADRKSVV